jgi:hypothetical protein
MSTTTTTSIGVVGLGHMGGTVAARFLAGGYSVFGEDRDRGHVDELEHEGLQWRDTPREVAEAADILFTSVPDDGVLELVASGQDGILAGLAAGRGAGTGLRTARPGIALRGALPPRWGRCGAGLAAVAAAFAAPALPPLPDRERGDGQRGERVEPPEPEERVPEQADKHSRGEIGAEDVLRPLARGCR